MNVFFRFIAVVSVVRSLICPMNAQAKTAAPDVGPTDVIVHGQFGGEIFGFELDPNGTLGLLSEAVFNNDGTIHAAVETFDQGTGQIVAVVAESNTQDDFVALGVTSNSIGIIELEHLEGIFNVTRTFHLINPLSAGQLTGDWTPPIGQNHIVNQIKASQDGSDKVAVYTLDTSRQNRPLVFTSNVGSNTFSEVFPITDPVFTADAPSVMTYDYIRNRIILGHDFPSEFTVRTRLGFYDLGTGEFTKMTAHGFGVVNGIALDVEDNVLCTDTSFVGGIEFYQLDNSTGIAKMLPGFDFQTNTASGADIEYDPTNQLFLVAQAFADGMLGNGSAIQVYDRRGKLVESLEGFNFQGGFSVFPIHITINPNTRSGFVQGPDLTTSLQGFTY